MAFPLSLDQQGYEALIELARRGTLDANGNVKLDDARRLDAFLRDLEKNNGIERDSVWIQWQEANQPVPPNVEFPTTWPPEMRFFLTLVTRKVAKVDVEAVLEKKATDPVNVLVTRDPAAEVGWTELDSFFIT